MERVEGVLVLRERPVAARRPLPGRLGIDVEQHRERASGELAPRPLREDGAAAERDDRRLAVAEHVVGDLLLERAEAGLAARGEQLGDGRARARLDLVVEIDEPAPEPGGDRPPDGRLARAHEPGEREVPPEGVQRPGCHRSPIRAR